MGKRKNDELIEATKRLLLEAIADIELSPPTDPEEIDNLLRSVGLDPVEVGRKFGQLVEDLLQQIDDTAR